MLHIKQLSLHTLFSEGKKPYIQVGYASKIESVAKHELKKKSYFYNRKQIEEKEVLLPQEYNNCIKFEIIWPPFIQKIRNQFDQ